MVMMGQQLMDSERKQEDDDIDDYVIKSHNNNNSSEEQRQHNSPEKMKRRDVPTLKSLAQLTHERHLNTNEEVDGVEEEEDDANNESGGDNNNKIIKQIVELRQEEANVTSKLNGVVVVEREEDTPSSPGPPPAVNGNGGEAIATSSGRTSSSHSSGIGLSLTTSSSSEPIEREGVSPTSEQIDNGPIANDGNEDEDVPENSTGGGSGGTLVVEESISLNSVDVPNGDINDSESCQALLLAHDFNEQMTAAKRCLKMFRDGIDTPGGTSTAGTASSRLKGADSSTDEDSTVVTSNKSAILSSTSSSSNINGCAGTIIKEKVGVSGGGGGRSIVSAAGKVSTNVLLPVQPSIHIKNPFQENGPPPSCVQEVWAHNLLEEFAKIMRVVKTYTFIAMDTEFPGIVVRPQCAVRSAGVFLYELLKVNVDRLKIIQLGITFMDKHGQCPPGVCTWQFNFKFSLNKDLYASDSISLLTRCGIQFEKHAECGINPEMFGEYFMSSGMVTNERVTYLTFHSGFDFGYLIKLLSNLPLPENEEKIFDIMKIYFPKVYDLKFLMKSVDLHGGLQDIANQMGQERVGTQHQARSDSLLTGMTFFKLLSTDVFNGEIDEAKYCGKLYGFHMTEDGKDEGWSEITGDNLLDATSPKPPPPTSRNSNPNSTNMVSNSLHSASQSAQHSSATATSDNR